VLKVFPFTGQRVAAPADRAVSTDAPARPLWSEMPIGARVYVAGVILAGVYGLALCAPRAVPAPWLTAALLILVAVTSSWKVNLPIPIANGSTLSVSYAADMMALLLLGPSQAVVIALAGAWVQCSYKPKTPYPVHRTLFSCAAVVLTMIATGAVYGVLGGRSPIAGGGGLARPLVGAIATYFVVNTGLVAGAVALSSGRGVFETWRRDFMWLAASFLAAGSAGALAAVVIALGDHWKAVLLAAPIYLVYRTYGLFADRLEDQKRHMAEMRELHEKTVRALAQAREAECALASEKQRLVSMLEEMERLEESRRHLLERERAARENAEQANGLKDQFLATLSHELRTPLTAILGWSDILRHRPGDDRLRERALASIHTSARRQAKIIEDLLDVARIVSGKLALERKRFNVEPVVRDAVQAIQPIADANGIRIKVESDPGLGPIMGDPARLQQVASNLLSNAVKFTPSGGTVLVTLRRETDGWLAMAVSDTGQGIVQEFLPAVFDRFRQADGSSTRVHRGLGLGLSIVKNLVEAHGGTVSAYSAGTGKGATFTVRLPAAAPQPALGSGDAGRAAIGAGAPGDLLDGLAVLVVDDDRESREVIAATLQERHAGVLTASSAAQALAVLNEQRVDVLLADIGMPHEDGYALIRKIRALDGRVGRIPAAAVTAFARDVDREQVLRAGFQLHLAKPVDDQTLAAAVMALAAQRETDGDIAESA
jgi:signal transduction histidine kinase/CheY-like chemotaxis protein